MDNFIQILKFAIIPIAIAWVGGNGYREYLKGKNDEKNEIRISRQRIIYDAKWLIGKLDSTSYELMGDFRKEMHFLSIQKYFDTALAEKIASFIPNGELIKYGRIEDATTQSRIYEEIVIGIKKAVVLLEMNWLLSPQRGFKAFLKF